MSNIFYHVNIDKLQLGGILIDMKTRLNNDYDVMTHRIFQETLERLTKNDDTTAERCYVSSNEYLSEYMAKFDLEDKKVATVGSSGDQFFVSLLQGCKDVTIIDGNPYTKAFVEYKMALFMNFDFYEMLKIISNSNLFHWSTYSKISHSLSRTSKTFWDTIMLEQVDEINPYYEQFDKNMIARQMVHPEVVFPCDFYHNVEVYNKLQALLRKKDFKLKFKTADIHDFAQVLPETYDLILLSNIFGYHDSFDLRYKFEKTIKAIYIKKLNPGGSLQVHYSYRRHYKSLDPNEIAGFELRIEPLGSMPNDRTVYFIDKPADEIKVEI